MLSLAVVFAFGGMCGGGGGGVADDPIVVPVKGGADEAWCCEYRDDAGATQYALVDGPSECNDSYGARGGRYVSGNHCLPCCCETPRDPDNAVAGLVHELTSPRSCANVGGQCKAGDAKECSENPTPVRRNPQRDRNRQVRPPTRGGGGERRTTR